MAIRRMILTHQNLTFSWKLGLGMNTIGCIAYYVASPLNIILFLFPESQLLWAVTIIILLKLILIGYFYF